LPRLRVFARLRLFEYRILVLKLHQRIGRLRIVLNRTRVICLKRGYLTGYEPNLRSNSVLLCAAVNHPVKVVDVFLKCFHIYYWMRPKSPNDQLRHRRALTEQTQNSKANPWR